RSTLPKFRLSGGYTQGPDQELQVSFAAARAAHCPRAVVHKCCEARGVQAGNRRFLRAFCGNGTGDLIAYRMAGLSRANPLSLCQPRTRARHNDTACARPVPVPRIRVELMTPAFSVRCSTTELPRPMRF